ncbi:GDP-mannose 4,6-dehydratase [Desulfofustis glycolicus]|uniref:GDP-mannose 4,6-dehydratase n=1 Tax=Desulfofustis glycolicus DSM 9705 TaxID=1121409 RepID=A0A1M5TZB0_9BACT|nr:GDP-mannose 4,6-dehydratase [Desulfofustis glycolicus]MCB2214744.1 GDP-mannose 4,6-dehydratase [Desulfobulbaceae bacterium]SHH56122.1 GDPmannose 4,6-dehydratase [Desulfofustis glycolicus DSM 9705]
MKIAFITGITGQDGSYLAEILLEKGYEVYGLTRRASLEDQSNRLSRIKHLLKDIRLLSGTLESYPSLYRALRESKPDEVYHLAAQSFVNYSFEDEFSTISANINGTHGLLAACLELVPQAKFYFAGSSEMFGSSQNPPQHEESQFKPRSAYGISKVAGYHLACNYRENYGLFTATGILFNHESPRRGFEFVTRKISSAVARIKQGSQERLELGNLDAQRDWGHAKEYVDAMWRMLQQDKPGDYVISTGKLHSVRDFCAIAFNYVDLDYRDWVDINPQFYRHETAILQGDSRKAEEKLNWRPRISFHDMVCEMVENDLRSLQS